METSLVDNKYRNSIIHGKGKVELRNYIKWSGLPWIYEEPTPEVDVTSPYNRLPKGTIKQRNYEIKLADVRKNMLEMEDRVTKYRQETINNWKPKAIN